MVEDERKEMLLEYYDKFLNELQVMDVFVVNNMVENSSVVIVNVSVFCGWQGSCKNCILYEFCFWCELKKICEVFYNVLMIDYFCYKKGLVYKD